MNSYIKEIEILYNRHTEATSKVYEFLESNFRKALDFLQTIQFGNMNAYKNRASASKIGDVAGGGCAYRIVEEGKKEVKYTFAQLIRFQRGHLAENIFENMLYGQKYLKQLKIIEQFNDKDIEANIDFVLLGKKKQVIFEVKTVPAPIDKPTLKMVYQVIFQMGMLMQNVEPETEIEGFLVALDVQTGWFKTFKVEFSDEMFERTLSKAEHLQDCFAGRDAPKATVQQYCSTCPFRMSCPAQGKFAEHLPEIYKEHLDFILKSREIEKQAKQMKEELKQFMVNTGIEKLKDEDLISVVSLKEYSRETFDRERFKEENPELYEKYVQKGTSIKMSVA